MKKNMFIVIFIFFILNPLAQGTPIENEAVQIAAGYSHSLALKEDGSVWAWGRNDYGQLGDGTTTNKSSLVQVSGLSQVTRIAAGDYHSLALKEDGSVWAWGRNSEGQLGDGTTTNKSSPVQVSGLSQVTRIAAGYYHSLALKEDGSVWAWGNNGNGQLGDGTTTNKSSPVQVSGLSQVTRIAAGYSHSLAIKEDCSVWAWGRNDYGQLGDGTTTNKSSPVQVSGLSQVTRIAAGDYHSLALKEDGSVWAWGYNGNGLLGDGTTTNKSSPVQVSGLSQVTRIAAGSSHSLAIKEDGSVWAWGQNHPEYGQLGYGYPTYLPEPVYSEIQFSQKNFTTSPNTTITIPVINTAQKNITVSFHTINGAAISGIDYIHTSGNLTFQANESQKEITITILNNPENQTEKTFVLNIGASDDIFLNDGSQAIITISSDNSVNAPYFQTFAQNIPGYGWTYYSSETTGRIQQTADCLRMDSSIDNSTSLNEAILHIDLFSAEDIQLNFFQKAIIRDTCTSLPTTYTDHLNGDGISISNNGNTWYRILDCDILATDSQGNNYTIDVDAEIKRIKTNHDPNFTMSSNAQIKFQQYGNRSYPSGGREWDNIAVNTAYIPTTMTTTIHYFGSQTGTLQVTLFDQKTGRQAVAPETYAWNIDTKKQDFIARIPTGNYTITAFIDTDETGEINAWEAHASYSIPVTFKENLNIYNTITIYDPKDQYPPQFIQHTGSYKAWFDHYPTIGQPDEDFDRDGYTNFQEYLNGTNPENADMPYQYNGYDPAFDQDDSDITHQYQIITTNPLIAKARPGEAFLVDVNYTTSDKNSETTGLGLAIHFNSAFMEFAGFSNVLTESLDGNFQNLTIAEILKDESDENVPNDGFEDTDKVIIIGWMDDQGGNNWPGTDVELPVCLCTLKFNVKSETQGITFTDRSVIRFSSTSQDTRYQFYASPTTVALEPFNFDIDGDGQVNAMTDGVLILQYLAGLTQCDSKYISLGAVRNLSFEILSYLENGHEILDVDGNGNSDALTDGLLILRYLIGLEGDVLIENAISAGGSRNTDDTVISYIKQYLPQKASPLLSATVQMPEYQEIILSPSNTSPTMGSTFDLSVMYNVSDNNETLPGIGIRIHYDSTKFDYIGTANMLSSAIAIAYEAPETPQYVDNDPNTDRMIIMGWVDIQNNNWPNQNLPCKLVDVLFKVKQIPECSTSINAEFTAVPAGYYGKVQHADIHIAQGPPSITITGEWEILEDTAGDVLFQITDPDTDLSDLSISVASFCPDLLETMEFQFSPQTAQQRIGFSPALNQYGSCPISITVCDQIYTVNESFMLSIISVDDPPTLSPIPDHTIYGKPLYAEVQFSVNDIDSPSDDFSFDFSSSNQIILPKDHINMIDDDLTKTLQIMPTTNEVGSVTVNVCVFSGEKSATQSFLVSFNQSPEAEGANYTMPEDKHLYLLLGAEDPENDPLSYTIVNSPEHGELTIDGDIAIYTPSHNYYGMDRFSFKVSDGFTDSNIGTIIINIDNTDDPPEAYSQTVTTSEDMPLNITLTAYSPDNLPLTFKVSHPPSNGTISQSTPCLTYTPNSHFYGIDSFLFVANDGNSDSEPAMISITVDRSGAYVLTLVGSGYGTVNINETSVLLPYTISVQADKQVCFTAVPDPDWQFINWTGDMLSTSNPTCVTVDQHKTIRANMAIKTFELNIKGNEPVTINNKQYNLPFSQTYTIHTPIVLESASDRFHFWEKDILIDQNPYTFTMDSDITITANFNPVPDWQTEMHVERWVDDSDVMQQSSVFFGVASQAYTRIASDLPDINSCHIILTNSSFVAMRKDFHQNNKTEYQWIISVDPHGSYGSSFVKTTARLSWDPSDFSTEGQYVLTNDSGEIVVSDMRITTEYDVTNTSYTLYTITWQRYEAFEFHLTQGWNLISLPISPSTTALETLFPDYIAAFEYKSGGYYSVSSIIPGKGYWIKIPSSKVYSIAGQPFTSSPTDYSDGWHLVGADYTETTPENEFIKVIFRYVNGGYVQAFTLLPGFGYWIKVEE
jgi:alpha-tubulin suppressor-like RCC1 family protein